MPTIYQFLENPEIFPYESTLSQNPDILNALIDYISKNPDPFIHNEQQCYVYPNRSAEILALGTTYRTIIVKKQRKNKKTNQPQHYYPYLDRLFKNLQSATTNIEESLLGYTNKVLVSLAKKTPEIYEYIKDNQDNIGLMVKNNLFLLHLKQFWVNFLIESTMSLYVFLKNIAVRALMFRIIDEKDLDNIVVYETLLAIYSQITKKLKSKILPEDQKEELQEICVNFHDHDFMTLLVLKVSSKNSDKTYFIGKLLNQMLNFPDSKVFTEFSMSHMEAIQEYFQSYEDSSNFMDMIRPDQIEILKMLLTLSQKGLLQSEYEINLMKRLLVYTSIHKKNSILHSLLIKYVVILTENQKAQIFKQMSVIAFLMKNSETKGCRYAYGSLIWKICSFWSENQSKLGKYLEEEEKKFVEQRMSQKNKKFENLTQYKLLANKSQLLTEESHEESAEKLGEKQQKSKQPEVKVNQ